MTPIERFLAVVTIGSGLLGMSACGIAPVGTGPSASPVSAQTATVARATVVGVMTVTGTVTQGTSFELHTQTAGTVAKITPDSVVVAPAGGGAMVSVTAPAGTRFETPLVAIGDTIVAGMAVAQATAPDFSVVTTLKPAELLRFVKTPLGARAQVDGGPGPFDCPLRDNVPSTPAGGSGDPFLACAVPRDTHVIAGMTATVVIQLEKADNALVLPVEAVAGTVDAGSVYRRDEHGQPVETRVGLGTTDGVRIVITSGLKEGDKVLVPGPWISQHHG